MAQDNADGTHCHTLMQFSGEALDPESISELIGLKPFSSKKRGTPMARPRPGRPTPLARLGVLSYSTHTLQSNDINDHFRYLLRAILPVVNEVKSLVDRDHLSWGIICFFDDPPSDCKKG